MKLMRGGAYYRTYSSSGSIYEDSRFDVRSTMEILSFARLI
jgi:hypothetical protein